MIDLFTSAGKRVCYPARLITCNIPILKPIILAICKQIAFFDKIVYIEVGAMMVGKIVNNITKEFSKGEEKGYFLFGGSTVVLFFKEDMIEVDNDIIKNSRLGLETKVKLGEVIGKKKR